MKVKPILIDVRLSVRVTRNYGYLLGSSFGGGMILMYVNKGRLQVSAGRVLTF